MQVADDICAPLWGFGPSQNCWELLGTYRSSEKCQPPPGGEQPIVRESGG
jgi:hypothetical protein